jgi:hypothetical protein
VKQHPPDKPFSSFMVQWWVLGSNLLVIDSLLSFSTLPSLKNDVNLANIVVAVKHSPKKRRAGE